MSQTREPVFTPRLRLGFGLLAFGLGLMFFSGKVLGHPFAGGIAAGIVVAVVGFVLVVTEALRDPPVAPRADENGRGGS